MHECVMTNGLYQLNKQHQSNLLVVTFNYIFRAACL